MLLGRLHHRNLVNLVGYCAEKGQHMLIYVYMCKGSLDSHLYRKLASLLCMVEIHTYTLSGNCNWIGSSCVRLQVNSFSLTGLQFSQESEFASPVNLLCEKS